MTHRGYSKYFKNLLFWNDLIILNTINITILYFHRGNFSFISESSWLKYFIIYNLLLLLIEGSYTPTNILSIRKLKLLPVAKTILLYTLIHAIIIILIIQQYQFIQLSVIPKLYLIFFLFALLVRVVLIIGLRWYRKKGYNYRNIIIVKPESYKLRIEKYIDNDSILGYRLKKVFDYEILGMVEKNSNYLKEQFNILEVDEVIIVPQNLPDIVLSNFIDFCSDHFVKVKLISELGVGLNRKFKISNLSKFWLFEVSPLPLDLIRNRVIKRIFDVIFSFIIILFILSWGYLIVGLIIYLDSGWPIIYKQFRNGKKNKIFYCYKFRTMSINSLADTTQAKKDDMRVTKVGKILRKSSFDELPQFINVLKGEMSVVGPRPHMVSHTKDYSKLLDRYLHRQNVKPGITGLAQVKGYRGEVNNYYDIKGRVDLDKFYVENWSFFLDMKIIFITILQIFKPSKNAY